MNLYRQRILLTGAAGGIGSHLAAELLELGARVCLLVRQGDDAEEAESIITAQDRNRIVLTCDVTRPERRTAAIHAVERAWGGVDLLINLAGVLDFGPLEDSDPGMLHLLLQVNVEAPMQLARALLPGMLERGHGRIVNVGSTFGGIAFPFFAAYSASKFALRGFSQALRRELSGSGVGVTYVAPRAVNTPFNPPVVHEMAAQGLMRMDQPRPVALAIARAIERERDEVYLGIPESLFARLNALWPSLVDFALRRQVPGLRGYASEHKAARG
jgi:short-subunit dehydrogenase